MEVHVFPVYGTPRLYVTLTGSTLRQRHFRGWWRPKSKSISLAQHQGCGADIFSLPMPNNPLIIVASRLLREWVGV